MSEFAIRQQIFGIMSAINTQTVKIDDAVKALLSSQNLLTLGKVYDYQRWAADWGTFITLFQDPASGRILGWQIGRRNAPAKYEDDGQESTAHQFILHGFLGVKDADATEKLFSALIEVVRAAFRYNFNLKDANNNPLCEMAGPVSADIIETRSFGSVLCHYCELSLPVQELNSQ